MLKRGLLSIGFLLLAWQLVVMLLKIPEYILPSPIAVIVTGINQHAVILKQLKPTVIEIFLGFFLAFVIGSLTAIAMASFSVLRAWMLPVVLLSQTLPTFAIAPLLVIWLGYGLEAKVITVVIILFFPITSSFYDGLKATPTAWVELANVMGATTVRLMCFVRIPAALPRLASGLRMAAVWAPMAAIVSEWVGSSQGLGFLILNANARMQIDLMFASLAILVVFSFLFYSSIDWFLNSLIKWED